MRNKLIFMSFLFLFLTGIISTNAQINQSEEISSLIKKKRAFNQKNGFGYRVQLINGNETVVKKTEKLFQIEYPTIKTYILFTSPEWKVQVGDYKTKLEADKALNEIQLKFNGSIVVPR